MPLPRSVRRAKHAESWYKAEASELLSTVNGWLEAGPYDPQCRARVIISPHAGHSFCGHVMGQVYKHLDTRLTTRVFILGPSHHLYTQTCLLTQHDLYRTPLGDLTIDQNIYQQLFRTELFEHISIEADEAEHSLELQLPFLQAKMRGKRYTIVPIIVGAMSNERHAAFGRAMAPYLDEDRNIFIISSDFCHWGSRFRFTFHDPSWGEIHQSVERLDKMGMKIIEQQNAEEFAKYLEQYGNTICGRHPIAIFLHALHFCPQEFIIEFRSYDMSMRARQRNDSSVSYAAAVAVPLPDTGPRRPIQPIVPPALSQIPE